MTRFTIAVVLVALAAARGNAQPVPNSPPPISPLAPPGAGAVAVPAPIVIPIPVTKPPAGYYKSGGVLVGADGNYPFDTGAFLLGGFDGLARYSGTFHMVAPGGASLPVQAAPGGPPVVESVPVYTAPLGGQRGRFFHRR